jgi:hypothetical protein
MKTFFPRSAGKWHLDMEMGKMATTAGRYYTLFRPSRCPDNGVHPTGRVTAGLSLTARAIK